MAERTYISVDKDGWTKGFQLSIGVENEKGGGHGYRIAGPKFNGTSSTVLKHHLTERDAREIRAFLDKQFPASGGEHG